MRFSSLDTSAASFAVASALAVIPNRFSGEGPAVPFFDFDLRFSRYPPITLTPNHNNLLNYTIDI